MAILVSDMQTRLEKRLGDIDDVTFLIQISEDLNQYLYSVAMGRDASQYLTTQDYTITSDPQTSAFPTGLQTFGLPNCGFFLKNSDGVVTDSKLPITGPGQSARGYFSQGANVVFTGLSNQTVTLYYVPTLDEITTTSQSYFVEDRYKELILEGLVMYYYRYNEDPRTTQQEQVFSRLESQFLTQAYRGPQIGVVSPLNYL